MPRSRTCLRLLALVSLLLLTSGCGQKGPLYHPDEPADGQTDEDAHAS